MCFRSIPTRRKAISASGWVSSRERWLDHCRAFDPEVAVDPLVLVRAVHIASTAIVAGAIIFQSVVIAPAHCPAPADHPTAALDKRLRMLVWAALAVALLSGL